jgi:hypothetical protein
VVPKLLLIDIEKSQNLKTDINASSNKMMHEKAALIKPSNTTLTTPTL